jgi:hypothetical protein
VEKSFVVKEIDIGGPAMIPNVCFIKKEIGIQINQVDVGMGVKR